MRRRTADAIRTDHDHYTDLAAAHLALSKGPRADWDAGTIPLCSGERPIGPADGLMYSDCRVCWEADGKRMTLCRRVRCLACGGAVDATDYCSPTCARADRRAK